MSFSPQFLDELRARVSLAGIVGRSVRLTKRGREYVGLCPFHKEKTPSFCVVEDKDFFHCFGCGAHGDAIGFVMQNGNLGFREAVEMLAGEAGLELPRESPQERERAQRQLDLQGVVEAAAGFFAEQLWQPAGAAGLAYLRRRGLDDATIRRFRLGFAPESRDALKRHLLGRVSEELLLEAGLLRRPEDGPSYDYFRHRVIFPIGDRGGRIIAFGGRVIGEGQPKYLNSPETPLFQKGRVLYGWAAARAAAARDSSAIVTEGYMDVIALHRAGFGTAVAPLGTALTEAQIEELWKLAPEPVLCFDGDAAGARAAMRAAERALPLLRPGFTLRFAGLPSGEDPDTLILRFGPEAMRAVLDAARPLGEVVWAAERGTERLHEPERRAALEQRLENRVRLIADRNVAAKYRQFFRDRLFAEFAGGRHPGRRGAVRPFDPAAAQPAPNQPDPRLLHQRRLQEVLVATMINHPELLTELAEDFAQIDFLAPDLDKLRGAIINVWETRSDLDAAGFARHLCQGGYDRAVDGLLSPRVYVHGAFARPEADLVSARRGWLEARHKFQQQRRLAAEIVRAERELAAEMSEARLAQLRALQAQMAAEERASAAPDGLSGDGPFGDGRSSDEFS